MFEMETDPGNRASRPRRLGRCRSPTELGVTADSQVSEDNKANNKKIRILSVFCRAGEATTLCSFVLTLTPDLTGDTSGLEKPLRNVDQLPSVFPGRLKKPLNRVM
ncbi:hypothetical protein F2P81_013788 [Scophthalmus maximus]|uniref:Uncharacterized protein n=1 Tax=Scophthalmus maximus TaxID=52904 RepID=A0A6A4SUE4_SCOMX|nr:hypothetical protein F2P81_013788 [Scophthalmus maximus]